MRTLVLIAALVIFVVWDFAQNNGHVTNTVIQEIIQFIRSFGF